MVMVEVAKMFIVIGEPIAIAWIYYVGTTYVKRTVLKSILKSVKFSWNFINCNSIESFPGMIHIDRGQLSGVCES